MVSHFIVYPFFALLLAGERGFFAYAVSFTGALIAVLTTSRATLGFAGMGYVLMFMLSAFRGWTARKTKVMAVGAIAVALLSPLVVVSFEKRFSSNAETSYLEPDEVRVALEKAAQMILSDHPMGVGVNHYVQAANIHGYNQRAGLDWTSSGAYVHNVYWLVAAETGYIGFARLCYFVIATTNCRLLLRLAQSQGQKRRFITWPRRWAVNCLSPFLL